MFIAFKAFVRICCTPKLHSEWTPKWAFELHYPRGQNGQGLIPTTFHVDGVEFFTNAEYVCWSMSSTLAAGNVPKLGDGKRIASFQARNVISKYRWCTSQLADRYLRYGTTSTPWWFFLAHQCGSAMQLAVQNGFVLVMRSASHQ